MPTTKNAKNTAGPDFYLDLVREFPLRPIRTDEELDRAIAMIDGLTDREELRPEEADYREVLADLVVAYEAEHDPEPVISGPEMLRFLIESKGVLQAKVAADAGVSESTISEILAGKRKISRACIRAFADYFRVEPAVFL